MYCEMVSTMSIAKQTTWLRDALDWPSRRTRYIQTSGMYNGESSEPGPGNEPKSSVFSHYEDSLLFVKDRHRGLKNIHDQHPCRETFRSAPFIGYFPQTGPLSV